MATPHQKTSSTQPAYDAIAIATQLAASAAKLAGEACQSTAETVTRTTTAVSEIVGPPTQQFVEQSTETIGKVVAPIAENPVIKSAAKVPGVNLLLTALGQVDIEQAQKDVDKLRQEYPLDPPDQLAHRIMVDTAMKAGGIGLLTNFVPPLALTLFAVDIAAVTTLQAEMVYRIAAAYGLSLSDPARRGEVLAVFGLSLGGSSTLKVGLGFVELIPVVGAVVGASNNAALIYSLGYVASRFYESKRQSQFKTTV